MRERNIIGIGSVCLLLACIVHSTAQPRISGGGSGSGSVVWPTSGDIVISNSTNAPAGLAEIDGKVAVGSGGVWIAGNVPISSVTGGLCTTTNQSVQYDNSGVAGCAPLLRDAANMELTGNSLEVGGANTFLTRNATSQIFIGDLSGAFAIANGGSNSTMTCVGHNACTNLPGDPINGPIEALGDAACASTSHNDSQSIVCIGASAGASINGTGKDVFVGDFSGQFSTGFNNACLGYATCGSQSPGSSGGFMTAVGTSAGQSISTGVGNTLFGYVAGEDLTTGNNNVMIGPGLGHGSSHSITTGSNNMLLGTLGGSACSGGSNSNVSNEFDFCGNNSSDVNPLIQGNLSSLLAGWFKFNVPDADPGYTVATLPASPPQGSKAFVTDATTCSYAVVGGGAVFCPVQFDGSAWHGPFASSGVVAWAIWNCNNGSNACTGSGDIHIVASSNVSAITQVSTGAYTATIGGTYAFVGLTCNAASTGGELICGQNGFTGGTNPSIPFFTEASSGSLADCTNVCTISIIGQ